MYAGAPTDTSEYNQVEVNGLKVYLRKNAVIAAEGLRVRLRNWGLYKRLIVEGLVA